jgi:IS30 family transposase
VSYHHLTIDERETIRVLLGQGLGPTDISLFLGRNKSTISREIARNGSSGNYRAHEAQNRYKQRRMACRPFLKVNEPSIKSALAQGLSQYWSPEQIVNTIHIPVSVPTIYRAIKSGVIPVQFREKLRRKGKPYKSASDERRGTIPGCISIDERPVAATNRSRLGDWEGDTIAGKRNTGHLVTLIDRKARFLVACKVPDRKAENVKNVICQTLYGLPCKSVTVDNGKEFAEHQAITETLKAPVYFAHPHSPWERPTNENANGLLRQFFSKDTHFDKVTCEQVEHVVNLLNHRPRKCLGWKSPFMVFNEICCT